MNLKQEKDLACAPSYCDMQIFPLRSFCIVVFIFLPSVERTEEWRKAVPSYTQSSGEAARWQWTLEVRHLELFSQRRKPGALPYNWEMGLHGDGHGLLHRVRVCGRQRRDLDLTNYMRAAAVLIHFRSPSVFTAGPFLALGIWMY